MITVRYVSLFSRLVLSDDYNRVLLKPEGQSPESDSKNDYENDISDDDYDDIEDDEYINASLLSVRALAYFFTLIRMISYTQSSRRGADLNLSSWAVAAV